VTWTVYERKILNFSARVVPLLLGLALGVPALISAQPGGPMEEIHARVQDHRRLAHEHGSILIAEITKMEAIQRGTCNSGIEHRVAYRVVESLWAASDSPVEPGYILTKGFIDCRNKQLASPPFAVGVKVLLYCGGRHFYCLPPALNTADNSTKLHAWLDVLRDGRR
jgi:hypothetical protein